MPDTNRTAFQYSPRPGTVLRGDVWVGARNDRGSGRAVVICHGFKGFKDWGFFPFAGAWLTEALGYPVVTFNFTGSGVGADLESFSEPEAFGHNTFSRECEDLETVLDGVAAGRLGDVDIEASDSIGVLGHSRGGVAAILSGERDDVHAVVTWASIASVERYESLFEGVPDGKAAAVRNARTGQVLPLHRDVVRDIRANRERFDLSRSLQRSHVPLLVVHGTEDASVPVDDGRRIAAGSSTARFEPVEGAGHTFGAVHPFEGAPDALRRALELSRDHFDAHL